MIISVIIATYNRSESLRQALKSFENMSVPPDMSWELIVVDNNSNDDTEEVCSQFMEKRTLPLRHVFEERQGKSFALNTGIKAANGNILAFTDDDCIVDPYWLISILKEFASDTSISGIGGRVELYNQNDKPVTIRTYKDRILFSSPRQLFNPPIIGINMAFKKRVFDEVGDMDPRLGPGTKAGAIFEDADYVYRAYKKGFKMVYSPNVLIYHNHGRRTETEVRSLKQKYSIGRGAFYCKYIMKGDIDILLMAAREIYIILTSLLKNILQGKPIKENIRRPCDLMTGIIYMARNFRDLKVK